MNEKEKISYLKALVYIATINEELDDSEKQFILNIANTYGLKPEQSEDLVKAVLDRKEKLEDILSVITERKTKLLLIYELIALCYADNNYSDKEKAGIIEIGSLLEVEKSKIFELENLLSESLKLQEKINIALEG